MPQSGSSAAPPIGGISRLPDTGTQGAIYNISKSARRLNGKPSSNGWGGPRNRADRQSDGLTVKQVEGIATAAQRAWRLGLPLNCHVTIHWERLGVPDSAAAAATGAFLTCVRDWLRKQGKPFAYAYTREGGEKGAHTHILAHLPPGARWHFQRSRRWLVGICGGPYFTGGIRAKRLRGTFGGRVVLPDLYGENLAAVVAYLTKGALPDVALVLELERVERGGRIVGKRCGTSQNIGANGVLAHEGYPRRWSIG